MCEPTHSINQYPPEDESGTPRGPMIEATLNNPANSKIASWIKKISGWFHFSRLGRGHSEALAVVRPEVRLWLPEPTKFEAKWWSRSVSFDGRYTGKEVEKSYALELAYEYAKRISIGNLHQLRQFLDASMRRSDNPHLYVDAALGRLFNAKGRDKLSQSLSEHKLYNLKSRSYLGAKGVLDRLIKCVLGYTRKRALLVPEWADDAALWAPGQAVVG